MKLSVFYLRPGMILQSPVYGQRGDLLLTAGQTLTSGYIAGLQRVGVLAVNVQSPYEIDMELAERLLEDTVKTEALTAVQNLVERNMTRKDYRRVLHAVQNVVSEILAGKSSVGGLAQISAYDSYTYSHSVDVCVLSVAIGHHLDLDRSTLLTLGMGALLHDIGKTRVPPRILNKPGPLTDKEFETIKDHPMLGYKMATEEFEEPLDPETAEIILNHHERFDGSGYPQALAGDELDKLSMICAMADMYNAMTTDRIYKKALPNSEAFEMLLASAGTLFSIDIVQAFAGCVEPYPVGTFVELSDGRRAYVVATNLDTLHRPVVKILDSTESVDLNKDLSLVIRSQLSQHEVSHLIMTKNRSDSLGSYF